MDRMTTGKRLDLKTGQRYKCIFTAEGNFNAFQQKKLNKDGTSEHQLKLGLAFCQLRSFLAAKLTQ